MNLLKFKSIYFIISLSLIIPGIFSLKKFGLKSAIDFTGGTVWEISLSNNSVDQAALLNVLSDEESQISIQKSDDSYIIRAKPISEAKHQEMLHQIENSLGEVTEIKFESVGPTLGKDLLKKTINAVLIDTVLILLFVAWRFHNLKFGFAAVVAMLHDTLILLGLFSLLGHFYAVEVDTLFVTAVLTTLSFSVHDTIVVFDRIRETLRHKPKASFEAIVNKSIVETLSRSVNNSMTIIFMLLSLFMLGGETIRNFTLALLIGTVAGTYSSTFTAAPLLTVLESFSRKKSS